MLAERDRSCLRQSSGEQDFEELSERIVQLASPYRTME